ncbi:MAG: hypothetical protein OEY25_04575 [Candidatus Aminicenantes bacterium]|nr:hypothetical protein [Candidatus Aminicenantes bacterium]MDH5705458.1 hypothetical protein [Candidatus Aminicenantes bacterium]
MKKSIGILLVFLLLLGATSSVFASEEQQKKPELRKEFIQLKYVKARQIKSLLFTYISEYGRILSDDELNIITIQDTPEIIEKMLNLIKNVDIKPVDILFTVDLIVGSFKEEQEEVTAAGKKPVDKGLESDPVMKEMQRVMSFKSLYKIGSALLRVQDGSLSDQRIGGSDLEFRLQMRPRYVREEKGDAFQVELELQHDRVRKTENMAQRENVSLIQTALNLRSGEKTIVGISKLDGGDRALVLVISGKIIR